MNQALASGMTSLMNGAAIDFGDSSVADVLLAAGARTDLRDKEGPLERARRDGNRCVIRSLER